MNLVLKNIHLDLRDFVLEVDAALTHQATAIFGPSGAGKTSLLDLIAGLRRARSAVITQDGRALNDSARGIFLPPRLRGIGYVAQDLALFPHLSVRRNLCYGARPNGNQPHFDRVVETLELRTLLDSSIAKLSGGEQQRVALGRALLISPKLLLLDEPLASLDAALKERILPFLARTRDEFGIPMLYVTHDRSEARALCGEVVELSRGRIVKQTKIDEWN